MHWTHLGYKRRPQKGAAGPYKTRSAVYGFGREISEPICLGPTLPFHFSGLIQGGQVGSFSIRSRKKRLQS